MKQILTLALMIVFLPLVLLALSIVFYGSGILDEQEDFSISDNTPAKRAVS